LQEPARRFLPGEALVEESIETREHDLIYILQISKKKERIWSGKAGRRKQQ
jgi:hypothetical protein